MRHRVTRYYVTTVLVLFDIGKYSVVGLQITVLTGSISILAYGIYIEKWPRRRQFKFNTTTTTTTNTPQRYHSHHLLQHMDRLLS